MNAKHECEEQYYSSVPVKFITGCRKKKYIYPLKVMLQFIHIYHIHVPDFKLFYVNWYNMNVAHKYNK
jgi:hypothetical protein